LLLDGVASLSDFVDNERYSAKNLRRRVRIFGDSKSLIPRLAKLFEPSGVAFELIHPSGQIFVQAGHFPSPPVPLCFKVAQYFDCWVLADDLSGFPEPIIDLARSRRQILCHGFRAFVRR